MYSRSITWVMLCFFLSFCAKKSEDGGFKERSRTSSTVQDPNPQPDVSPKVNCLTPYTPAEWLDRVHETLYLRKASAAEKEAFDGTDYSGTVDKMLASEEAKAGIGKFVSNLLHLDNIQPTKTDTSSERLGLIGDLRQEPVQLVLKNLDKPWPWFFNTTTIQCTNRTAALYGLEPKADATSFFECTPPKRAGLFSLISFLRSHPEALYLTNNNYGRSAAALYLTTGIQLTGDPFREEGPPGGAPLAECVSTLDRRMDLNDEPFGTISIAEHGTVCAGCHSPHLAPLSIAFREFSTDGSFLSDEDIDAATQAANAVLKDRAEIKSILAERSSCWSPEVGGEPQEFSGAKGLGSVAAESPTLGRALGLQIPVHLTDEMPDENKSWWIQKNYETGGKTLPAAIKGLYLSESFQCKQRASTVATQPVATETLESPCESAALQVFAEVIGPAIVASCQNCHSVGSGGMFLKPDDHLTNRANLLVYTEFDAQKLIDKISSPQTHGGGNQWEKLTPDAITSWHDAENACRP